MARLVGSVEFNSRIDGRNMPRDAERVGNEAGAAGSKGFGKEWDKGVTKAVEKSGKKTERSWTQFGRRDGTSYSKAFNKRFENMVDFSKFRLSMPDDFMKDFSNKVGSADEAVRQMRESIDHLNQSSTYSQTVLRNASKEVDIWARKNGVATDEMQRSARVNHDLTGLLDARLHAIQKVNKALDKLQARHERQIDLSDRLRASMDRLTTSTRKNGLAWKDLSQNTRQWTLIIAAVAAAGENIAALGSAAGAGLIALGGGIAALGVGALGIGAVFVNLIQKIEKAPPAMRPTIQAFLDLRKAWGDMNDSIALAAFDEMDGTFRRLRGTLSALTPDMTRLGTAVGDLADDMAVSLSPGRDGFREIQALVRNSVPLFDKMARSTGTLGVALLRAFDRANPLVQSMVDWVDTLIKRFDTFTRGDGFDVWMGNAKRVFGSLGPLLDATGRALNDLVTPDSVQRTTEFLDRLTSFMPNLERILSALGSVDVFGVLAAALDDLGKGLEPILPALEELGATLRDRLIVTLDAFATGLSIVSELTTPLVHVLNDFLKAIPAPVIQAAAVAVTALATAFAGMKIAQALDTAQIAIRLAIIDVQNFVKAGGSMGGVMGRLGDKATGLVGKFSGMIGTAGIFGAVAAGALVGGKALDDLWRKMQDFEGKANELVASNASIKTSYETLGRSAFGVLPQLTDVQGALDKQATVGSDLSKFFPTLIAAWSDGGRQAAALSSTLGNLDGSFASMANNSLATAQQRFYDLTQQLGANDQQILGMLTNMPEFKKALEGVAAGADGVATNQEILNTALGRGITVSAQAADGSYDNLQALNDLTAGAKVTESQIKSLSDAVKGFGSQQLDTRSASRDFEQAISDLSGKLNANGLELRDTTDKGRENNQAIDDLIRATNNYAGSVLTTTGNQDKANAVLAQGREQLRDMIGKFDNAGLKAGKYNDILKLIPDKVSTTVDANTAAAQNSIDKFISRNQGRTITFYGQTTNTATARAAGTVTRGPEYALIGEAGPEAVVPLNRPLSQVDPSVRWLSAIAQGKHAPMASGGVVGAGKQITVEAGAIVVQEAGDPYRSANEVQRRLFERVAG